MKTIAIVNQKGGVGKTTTCVNLAACLAAKKQKVLLIDLDAQGNTTSGLGIEKQTISQSVYDVLLDAKNIETAIIKQNRANLDVLASSIDLAGAEVELATADSRENRLKKALDLLVDLKEKDKSYNYDFILIDCPPSLSLLTINALTAANSVLIPIQAEYYALEGVSQLLKTIDLVKTSLNANLEIFGVLVTMYDSRTQLSKQVYDEVKNFFPKQIFNTVIPRNVRLSEAPSYGQAVIEYAWISKGSLAYTKLAKEVIKRCQSACKK